MGTSEDHETQIKPVDVHAHAVTDGFLAALKVSVPAVAPVVEESGGHRFVTVRSGKRLGPLPVGMFQTNQRLADMDEMGIAVQIVSAPPWVFSYDVPADLGEEIVSLSNDSLLTMANEAPDRIGVLIGLPMQSPEHSLRELRRLADNRFVRGIAIGTAVNDADLDDPSFDPIWSAVEQLGLAVLVHPVASVGRERMQDYYLLNLVGNPFETTLAIARLIFGGVLMRYPKLRFCVVHAGGFAPYQLGRWRHGFLSQPQTRAHIPDPPEKYFGQLFFDSLSHDSLALEFLINRVDVAQIVLGSDYMFPMGDSDPMSSISSLGLPRDQMVQIAERNVERLFPRSKGM